MMNVGTQTEAKPAKVLIVDDHPTMREGLAIRLSQLPDLEICGEVSDSDEAIEFVGKTVPDIAVVDITLKTSSGIELIKHLKELTPAIRVLVWSMHVDSLYAERALRAGADGYINKEQATDHVIEAIRHILAGKIYLSGPTADQLLRRSISGARQTSGTSSVDMLSDCELETFRLIGEGLSTKEVARKMNTHLRTVETYLARIKKKFNLEGRQQLVHAAIQWALENHRLPGPSRADSGDPSAVLRDE